MPFRDDRLHPKAKHIYRLALKYGAQLHPIAVAFWAQLAIEFDEGYAYGIVMEAYECINERRASRGLPPIPEQVFED